MKKKSERNRYDAKRIFISMYPEELDLLNELAFLLRERRTSTLIRKALMTYPQLYKENKLYKKTIELQKTCSNRSTDEVNV